MRVIGFLFGGAFGALITAGRLNEYDVIHSGLRLTNLYMFFVMGSAVVVAAAMLVVLRRLRWVTPLGGPLSLAPGRVERKHITGGVAFGVGWAVTGTCPAPALAMAGSGGILGLFVVAGICGGLMLRDAVTDRPVSRSARAAPRAGVGKRLLPEQAVRVDL